MSVAIDLAPTINTVILPLLGSVLIAAATWAVTRVAALAHITIQDSQRKIVADAITNGLAFAQQRLGPGEKINTSQVVADAVGYILPKVPDALKALNITPDHLAEVVQAKLPVAPTVAVAAPPLAAAA